MCGMLGKDACSLWSKRTKKLHNYSTVKGVIGWARLWSICSESGHLYSRLFLWCIGNLFLSCSSYTVRRNFSNWSTLLWKGRALVSQLDGGFHEQYFAYEWTIVQAIFWHYQTFSSIFWVFFTSQLSSENNGHVRSGIGSWFISWQNPNKPSFLWLRFWQA